MQEDHCWYVFITLNPLLSLAKLITSYIDPSCVKHAADRERVVAAAKTMLAKGVDAAFWMTDKCLAQLGALLCGAYLLTISTSFESHILIGKRND